MIEKSVLKGIYRGKVAEHFGVATAIAKEPIKGEVYLSVTGLAGDECADTRHHGGTERALHQYPAEHYAFWRNQYGDSLEWLAPGMGENLSSEGMLEDSVCIGDRYLWGDAIIELSQPRSPCFKLNLRWQQADFSSHMQQISRCGWLYRVIRPGMVSAESPLVLTDRPDNAMTVAQVCDIFFGAPLDKQGLGRLSQQDRLSESWMSKVRQRIETGKVENWNFRLYGQP